MRKPSEFVWKMPAPVSPEIVDTAEDFKIFENLKHAIRDCESTPLGHKLSFQPASATGLATVRYLLDKTAYTREQLLASDSVSRMFVREASRLGWSNIIIKTYGFRTPEGEKQFYHEIEMTSHMAEKYTPRVIEAMSKRSAWVVPHIQGSTGQERSTLVAMTEYMEPDERLKEVSGTNSDLFGTPIDVIPAMAALDEAKERLSRDLKSTIAHLDKITHGISRVVDSTTKVAEGVSAALAHLPKNIGNKE